MRRRPNSPRTGLTYKETDILTELQIRCLEVELIHRWGQDETAYNLDAPATHRI